MTIELILQAYAPIAGIIGVVIWATRADANLKNNTKTIGHLTKSGEGMKKQIAALELISAKTEAKLESIEDTLKRIEKNLDK